MPSETAINQLRYHSSDPSDDGPELDDNDSADIPRIERLLGAAADPSTPVAVATHSRPALRYRIISRVISARRALSMAVWRWGVVRSPRGLIGTIVVCVGILAAIVWFRPASDVESTIPVDDPVLIFENDPVKIESSSHASVTQSGVVTHANAEDVADPSSDEGPKLLAHETDHAEFGRDTGHAPAGVPPHKPIGKSTRGAWLTGTIE